MTMTGFQSIVAKLDQVCLGSLELITRYLLSPIFTEKPVRDHSGKHAIP